MADVSTSLLQPLFRERRFYQMARGIYLTLGLTAICHGQSTQLLLKDISSGSTASAPASLTPIGSHLFFTADDGDHGRELWVSDGSAASTHMVKDILPGNVGSGPEHLTVFDGQLFFHADDGSSSELWRSDGTEAGTVKLSSLEASADHLAISTDGTSLYSAKVIAGELTLWRSAGAANDLEQIATVPGTGFGNFAGFYYVGGTVFFDAAVQSATGGAFEYQIRRLDETTTGNSLVHTQAMPNLLHPTRLQVLNDALLFQTASASGPTSLWRIDPTGSSPVKVASLHSTYTGQSALGFQIAFASSDHLIFVHPTRLGEVWMTNGTGAGTRSAEFSVTPGSKMILSNGDLYYSRSANSDIVAKVNFTDLTTLPSWQAVHTQVGQTGLQEGLAAFGQIYLDAWNGGVGVISPRLSQMVEMAAVPGGSSGLTPQSFTATSTHLFFTAEAPGIGRELFGITGIAQTELNYQSPWVQVSDTEGIDFGVMSPNDSKYINLVLTNKSAVPVQKPVIQIKSGTSNTFGAFFGSSYISENTIIPPLGSILGFVSCRLPASGAVEGTYILLSSDAAPSLRQIPLVARNAASLPLRIDSIPASGGAVRLKHPGQALEIRVPQTLTPTSTLRWLKNGNLISTAKQATLSLPSLLTSDAGSYRVEITEAGQASQSATVHLAMVSSPISSRFATMGSTFPVVAKLTTPPDMAGTVAYLWHHDQASLLDIEPERILGVETGSLSVKKCLLADSGEYHCRIRWTPPGLTVREILTQVGHVEVVTQPAITTTTLADAYVGQSVSVPLSGSQFPQSFSASGLPPGIKLNTATGVLSGQATAAKVVKGIVTPYSTSITCSNPAGRSLAKPLLWKIHPLPEGIGGSFRGIVDRDGINQDLGGSLLLTVTSKASYSATLTLGAVRHSFSGTVTVSPDGSTASFQASIHRSKLATLIATGTLQTTTGTLIGTIRAEGSSAACSFDARRVLVGSLLPTSAQIYNAQLVSVPTPDSTAPQGSGFTRIAISNKGVATFTGRVADGSSFTTGTTLVESNTPTSNWRIGWHQLLRTSTGSIQGWQEIAPQTQRLNGTTDWRQIAQPSVTSVRAYRLGFRPQSLIVTGSRYTHTVPAILDLDQTAPVSQQAQFIIDTRETNDTLTLYADTRGKLSFITTSTLFPRLQSCTITTAGLITARYLRSDSPAPPKLITRTADLHGLIIPHLGIASGFCLMPDLAESADSKIGPTRAKIMSLPMRLEQVTSP